MSETEAKARNWFSPGRIAFVLVLYILTWALFGYLSTTFNPFQAFVSGLALLGVVAALLLQYEQIGMQQEELGLQRREIALNREELQRAAAAQEESATAMAEQLAQQDALAKSRFTLELYDEWHSESMHEARTVVDGALNRANLDVLDLKSILQDENGPISPDERRQLFRILHCFEKWALLEKSGVIDVALMSDLLGVYTSWWKANVIDIARDDPEDPAFTHLPLVRNSRLFANPK
jgi:hypothetical protein